MFEIGLIAIKTIDDNFGMWELEHDKKRLTFEL